VIGGGETAASILNELFRHRVSTITVISPQVTLFTRGESFFENTLFSDPTGWNALTLAERRDALNRTDRGVFSARVQDLPLFTQDVLDLLELGLGGPLTGDALQESIGHDLAVAEVYPKLFLPGLSGLTQGPGFPNLSSLGLLSDRVLGADLTEDSPSARSTRRFDEQQSVR
jgi:mycobactin lysine-N-oxygenase